MTNLIHKVLSANDKYKLFDKNSKIIVALSGGADSCALLYALISLREEYSLSLRAVHINHSIRGAEADRDERFVKSICEDVSVPLTVYKYDVPKIAQDKHESIELCARKLRYEAFDDELRKYKFDYIATAHNSNDVCETLVFNLLRGTGLEGVCSIPPKRDNIIRPLILCKRSDIENYLEKSDKKFVTDSTNSDTEYTRNFIRHKIMPEFKKLNSSAEDIISRSISLFQRDIDFINSVVEKNKCNDVKVLAELHPAVLSRIIMLLWKESYDNNQLMLENVHISEIEKLISKAAYSNGVFHKELSLPGNRTVKVTEKKIIFSEDTINISNDYNIFLSNGENTIDNTEYMFYVSNSPDFHLKQQSVYTLFNTLKLFADKIEGKLFVRNRNVADYYVADGITRNVKKMLCNKKIPLEKRDVIPFLCDNKGIIYIPGCPVCDRLRPDNNTNSILYIHIFKKAGVNDFK